MSLYYYLLIALAVVFIAVFFSEVINSFSFGARRFVRSVPWRQRLVRSLVAVAVCLWIVTAIMGVHSPLFWEGLSGKWAFVNVFWNLLFEPFALVVISALISLAVCIGGLLFVGLKLFWGWLWQGDANYY